MNCNWEWSSLEGRSIRSNYTYVLRWIIWMEMVRLRSAQFPIWNSSVNHYNSWVRVFPIIPISQNCICDDQWSGSWSFIISSYTRSLTILFSYRRKLTNCPIQIGYFRLGINRSNSDCFKNNRLTKSTEIAKHNEPFSHITQIVVNIISLGKH